MTRHGPEDKDVSPRDLAARAAWMSFVGGMTQDQIARDLGISRQRAQRLVARATAEGLVRVRVDHPIAACLDLERRLRARFDLLSVRVAPSVGAEAEALRALAPFAAPELERLFHDGARVLALGTGRTLRAVVEEMQPQEAPGLKVVSLIGNVSPDGSASFYEVIMRLADKTGAAHYPMSIPVFARNEAEYAQYLALPHVRASRDLALTADMAVVGIGQMTDDAPLHQDGFLSAADLRDLQSRGAAGEICGHIFDDQGRYLDHVINRRMVGIRVPFGSAPVLCIAGGSSKIGPMRAALRGQLIHHLITDELSARALLDG
ncbi:sugar-binding transcriptional regulator [Pseudooceanicola aestuarii]|uniref:sugar-binding transcriptional regulator n=1 Tax=Pseudooceanicola aestuarii TaxID=2697319 RepID=UPI0013D7E3E7|nr:sugar-binding transcriptional regulator [Pseudooceanicola aestuarii]